MVKKLPLKLYEKIYSLVPRLCVDVLIKSDAGIILVKRDVKPCEGMWHLPGSTVLLGESLESAVKRTAREETGLNVRIKKQLGVKEYSRKAAFGQAISIVYLAESLPGKLKGNEFGKNARCFKEIPKKTIKEHKEVLENYSKETL